MALRVAVDAPHDGQGDIAVVQIAGLVARRIRLWSREGDQLLAGQRFGMIRLRTRTDLYLPPGTSPLLLAGQRRRGGASVVAGISSREARDRNSGEWCKKRE